MRRGAFQPGQDDRWHAGLSLDFRGVVAARQSAGSPFTEFSSHPGTFVAFCHTESPAGLADVDVHARVAIVELAIPW